MVIQHSDVTKTSGLEAIIKLKQNVQNVNGNDSLTFLKISKNKSPPFEIGIWIFSLILNIK